MAENPTPSVVPTTFEWPLRNARTREERVFVQSELSIEGEARLVGLGRKIAAILAAAGYTFEQVKDLFTNEEQTDWLRILNMIADASESMPDLVADAATVFFNIYPTTEEGAPNPDYEIDRRYLRGSLNLSKMEQVIEVAAAQNDYARLLGPFAATLSDTMAALRGGPSGAELPTSSVPGRVISSDGSEIEIEPLGSPTPSMTEAPASASETPSEVSPG